MPDVRLTPAETKGKLPVVCMCCGARASERITRKRLLKPLLVGNQSFSANIAAEMGGLSLLFRPPIPFPFSFCRRHSNHFQQQLLLVLGGAAGFFVVLFAGLGMIAFMTVVAKVNAPWVSAFVMVPILLYVPVWILFVKLKMARSIQLGVDAKDWDTLVLRNVHPGYIEALERLRERRSAPEPVAEEPPSAIPVGLGPVASVSLRNIKRKVTDRQKVNPNSVAISIILAVMFLGLIGIRLITFIEKRFKQQQAYRPAPAAQSQPPQPEPRPEAPPPPRQEEPKPQPTPQPPRVPPVPLEPERDFVPGTVVNDVPRKAPLPAELKKRSSVDLLELFNPRKDIVQGRWLLTDTALHCNDVGAVPRVQFPYLPPEEYDFIVTFAQPRLRNGVSLVMPKPVSGCFFWFVGGDNGSNYGFYATPPKKGLLPGLITPGSVHTTKVEVRKNSLRGYLDGKKLMEIKADYRDLSDDGWRKIHNERYLSVACDDPVVFYSIRVVEVTGHGKKPREEAAKKAED